MNNTSSSVNKKGNWFKNWYETSKSEVGLYCGLIILIIFLSIASPNFLKLNNFINIIRQVSIVGVIAIGGFMVILTGGMDISVGNLAALTGVIIAKLSIDLGMNVWLAMLIALVTGACVGLLNGFLTIYMKMPSFIATLGVMQVCQGTSYVITQAAPISNFNKGFLQIGRGYLGPIPIPIIILAVLYLVMSLFMRYSKFGTYCYAIGGNREAARLSGIRVNKVSMIVYMFGGLFSAIGGVIVAARTNAGSAQVGSSYLFDVFTACVLGGTSLSGGIGRLPTVIVGCLFVGLLNNGLTQLSVDSFVQMIVQGVVLVLAVILQVVLNQQKSK